MKSFTTDRGFNGIEHSTHANQPETKRLIQESSAIGDYEDSMEIPGSSYLWIGEHMHLDREETQTLIQAMEFWLETKRLPEDLKQIEDEN